MTAIITGERGERSLTRPGLEEYVSDCVILLDHRVTEQLSTRRLRVGFILPEDTTPAPGSCGCTWPAKRRTASRPSST